MQSGCTECGRSVDAAYGNGKHCFDCAAEARRAGRMAFADHVDAMVWLIALAALVSLGWAWWSES